MALSWDRARALKRRDRISRQEARKQLSEFELLCSVVPVETQHGVVALSGPAFRRRALVNRNPRDDLSGDRLVLPANERHSGQPDERCDELFFLAKRISDVRGQTEAGRQRRDGLVRAAARALVRRAPAPGLAAKIARGFG
jgi:hypothetical protein